MDISTTDDIGKLVNSFYDKVREDDLIGPIIIAAIGNEWPAHLEKMVRFWQTVLLEEHTYYGSPFAPHARMPLEATHFDRWLGLWNGTVDGLYQGPKAAEAKWRAAKMAEMFLSKILYYRNNTAKPIL